MDKKTYKLTGLDCPSCAALLESDLEDKEISAKVSFAKCELCLTANGIDEKKLTEIVEKCGYKIRK